MTNWSVSETMGRLGSYEINILFPDKAYSKPSRSESDITFLDFFAFASPRATVFVLGAVIKKIINGNKQPKTKELITITRKITPNDAEHGTVQYCSAQFTFQSLLTVHEKQQKARGAR